MATGIKKLRKVQWGIEDTPGTPVAATIMWRGPGAGVECLDVIEFVEEDIGSYGDANRTVLLAKGAQITIPETLFTFEQFPLLLETGVEAIASGSADGDGSGKVYTFDFSLTSANTIKAATIEAGNNEECADVEYCFCKNFSVTGEPGGGVMFTGLMRGRQYTAGQEFASLTAPTVNSAVFNNSKLCLDAVGGTMGATPLAGSLLGFTINVTTGYEEVTTGEGSLYFYNVELPGWEITADVVFKHIAGADTEHANWLAQTARLLEINLEGPALATAGTYSKYTTRFQLPGKWKKFAPLTDRNGVDILTGTFVAKYDPTASLGPKIVVVNETATYWS